MDLLVILVMFAVLGLMLVGFVGFGVLGVAGSKKNQQAEKEKLETLFDGSERVSYQTQLVGATTPEIIRLASEHGYDLANSGSGGWLFFEKRVTR